MAGDQSGSAKPQTTIPIPEKDSGNAEHRKRDNRKRTNSAFQGRRIHCFASFRVRHMGGFTSGMRTVAEAGTPCSSSRGGKPTRTRWPLAPTVHRRYGTIAGLVCCRISPRLSTIPHSGGSRVRFMRDFRPQDSRKFRVVHFGRDKMSNPSSLWRSKQAL